MVGQETALPTVQAVVAFPLEESGTAHNPQLISICRVSATHRCTSRGRLCFARLETRNRTLLKTLIDHPLSFFLCSKEWGNEYGGWCYLCIIVLLFAGAGMVVYSFISHLKPNLLLPGFICVGVSFLLVCVIEQIKNMHTCVCLELLVAGCCAALYGVGESCRSCFCPTEEEREIRDRWDRIAIDHEQRYGRH